MEAEAVMTKLMEAVAVDFGYVVEAQAVNFSKLEVEAEAEAVKKSPLPDTQAMSLICSKY